MTTNLLNLTDTTVAPLALNAPSAIGLSTVDIRESLLTLMLAFPASRRNASRRASGRLSHLFERSEFEASMFEEEALFVSLVWLDPRRHTKATAATVHKSAQNGFALIRKDISFSGCLSPCTLKSKRDNPRLSSKISRTGFPGGGRTSVCRRNAARKRLHPSAEVRRQIRQLPPVFRPGRRWHQPSWYSP